MLLKSALFGLHYNELGQTLKFYLDTWTTCLLIYSIELLASTCIRYEIKVSSWYLPRHIRVRSRVQNWVVATSFWSLKRGGGEIFDKRSHNESKKICLVTLQWVSLVSEHGILKILFNIMAGQLMLMTSIDFWLKWLNRRFLLDRVQQQ